MLSLFLNYTCKENHLHLQQKIPSHNIDGQLICIVRRCLISWISRLHFVYHRIRMEKPHDRSNLADDCAFSPELSDCRVNARKISRFYHNLELIMIIMQLYMYSCANNKVIR